MKEVKATCNSEIYNILCCDKVFCLTVTICLLRREFLSVYCCFSFISLETQVREHDINHLLFHLF